MRRFDPVICAIDLGELAPQVIGAARTLARAAGGDLRVVHVAPAASATRIDDAAGSRRILPPRRPAASAAEHDALGHSLADAEAMMSRLGISAQERLELQGDVALEIQAVATRLDAAILVIGTRGRGSVMAAVLGSVSRALLRSAPCPVMVVPRGRQDPLRGETVLCGVDDDHGWEAAASTAARLAMTIGSRLVLAHVEQRKDAVAARHAAASLPVEELSASAGLDPARLLGGARQHVPEGLDVTLAMRQGVAAEQLAVLARELDAASVVVASRGPGPLRTMVGGSVAQELTTRSHCPVVVVPSVAS